MKRWAIGLLSLLLFVVPRTTWAAAPAMRAWLEPDTVEQGERVELHLQATAEGEAPSEPLPGSTAGMTIRGTSTMPQQTVTITNGVRRDTLGVHAVWIFRAEKVGTFRLGPPTVRLGGKRHAAEPVTLRVVARGSRPTPIPIPPSGSPFGMPFGGPDPFDMWKDLFRPDDLFQRAEPEANPSLALPAPRDSLAFLHASIDKTRAVVGEQVTLQILLYVDAEQRMPEISDPHEPAAADFVKRRLTEEEANLGFALVGGRPYRVTLLQKNALFPLKSGVLDVGSMSLMLIKSRSNGRRTSENLRVTVSEPPAAGRPPGYALGTVGQFTLSADVTPRQVAAGAAVAVQVELKGTGNLPASLPVPTLAGVEWLEPQVHEKLGAQGDRYGGVRSFSYVVKLTKSGSIDLGDISIPYFDPDSRKYEIARAALGRVEVTPSAVKEEEKIVDKWADIPKPLAALESHTTPAYLADKPWFVYGLLFPNVALVGVWAASRFARRTRDRREAESSSPRALLKMRIAEAEAQAKAGASRDITGATTRALEAALVVFGGASLRALTGPELSLRLRDDPSAKAWADDAVDLLLACESVRFSPVEETRDVAESRWLRAKSIIDQISRSAP